MILAFYACVDSAWALIGNVCITQLRSSHINWPINHRDRDTLTRVAFSSRLLEVIVRKVGLIGCGNGIRGLRRGNGNCDKSQGES